MSAGVPLTITRDGGALLALTSNSFGDKQEFWIVKLNRAGSIDFPHGTYVDGYTMATQPEAAPIVAAPVDEPVKAMPIARERIESEVTPMTMSVQSP